MKSCKLFFLVAVWFSVALQAHAAGTAYYINNQLDSNCSDKGQHSLLQPWCTFAPLNALKSLSPGDQVLLAKGSMWDEQLTLSGSGTAADPIVLTAYGKGSDPKIIRRQRITDICILMTDVSHWNLSNLEVGRASAGIVVHYTRPMNEAISISNVYAHDNKGIWGGYSTAHPVHGHSPDPFAAALNLNISSGILFNTSANLVIHSSQYILKGASLDDIRGEHNVDSVAFDAETNTTDNQDGHNAFQDVTLNGLLLVNDNGHARHDYQAAGLGCSDSLRLIGVTRVLMLNSILYNEAACHTATGTAAIILGRVNQATLVNNIIFGVPPSHSPDETGIDLEWSETKVDLHANLFAANAGAGVEILNIHQGDQTADLDFYDNTFANNARTFRPGAASVWEDSKGAGYATPSGSIHNNFYTETRGAFFDGRNIGAIRNADNIGTPEVSNYGAQHFSPSQGRNRWRYIYQKSSGAWANLPAWSPSHHNGAWEASASRFVSAFEMQPATCATFCESSGVARVWVAPRRGFISIRGHVLQSNATGGAGVLASIKLVEGSTKRQLWPMAAEPQLLAATDQSGYATDLDEIQVEPGDQIRFEVYATSSSSSPVSWTPSIAYTSMARLETAATGSAVIPTPAIDPPMIQSISTR